MANTHSTLTSLFSDIADAIREKTGGTQSLIADNFPTDIRAISSSGDNLWLRHFASDTLSVDTTATTMQLVEYKYSSHLVNEYQYSTSLPVYDVNKKKWVWSPTGTIIADNAVSEPPTLTNVYVKSNETYGKFYYITSFSVVTSSSSSYTYKYSLKGAVSSRYQIVVGDDFEYVTSDTEDKYTHRTWIDDVYYEKSERGWPNGRDWTTCNCPVQYAHNLSYNNGMWVCGSSNVTGAAYSFDAKTWTISNLTSRSVVNIRYSKVNGLWTAYDTNGKVPLYSTDGKNWQVGTINITGVYSWTHKYGNGIWAGGSDNGGSPKIGTYYSTDGKNWTQGNITTVGITDIEYSNGLWVAISKYWSSDSLTYANKGIYYSLNGTTWTLSNITDTGGSEIKYCSDDEIWLAFTGKGIYYSLNGTTWTLSNITDVTATANDRTDNLVYVKGKYVYPVKGKKIIYQSIDGRTWEAITTNIPWSINSLRYANGLWIASTSNGLYYSVDLIEWSQATNIATGQIYTLLYENGIWLASQNAVSQSYELAYSVAWELLT